MRAEAVFGAPVAGVEAPSLPRWIAALVVIVLLAVFALAQKSET